MLKISKKKADNYSSKVHFYAVNVQLDTACDKNSDLYDLANCLE